MARVLQTFKWDNVSSSNAKYPWDKWQNGETWEIKQGVDFDISLRSMRQQIYNRANACGREASVVMSGDDKLVFRFTVKQRDTNVKPIQTTPRQRIRKG